MSGGQADGKTVIDFMRHGEPLGGKRYRGSSIDDALSEQGWAQMRATVGDVCPWTQIVSSPLARCHAFAHELSQQHGIPLVVDDRLKEVGFGEWEGFTRAQIQVRNLAQYQAFYADPVNNRPPGAEPLELFFTRVAAAFKTIMADFSQQHVLVVAHAGVVRAAMAHVLEVPAHAAYRVQVVNAGLSRFVCDADGSRLEFLNRDFV